MSDALPIQSRTVAVGPTSTVVLDVDTRNTRLVSVLVENLDASQSVACVVYRRVFSDSPAAPSTLGDLADIGPLGVAAVDIDTAVNMGIVVEATASGVGCNVRVSARPDFGRRG